MYVLPPHSGSLYQWLYYLRLRGITYQKKKKQTIKLLNTLSTYKCWKSLVFFLP